VAGVENETEIIIVKPLASLISRPKSQPVKTSMHLVCKIQRGEYCIGYSYSEVLFMHQQLHCSVGREVMRSVRGHTVTLTRMFIRRISSAVASCHHGCHSVTATDHSRQATNSCMTAPWWSAPVNATNTDQPPTECYQQDHGTSRPTAGRPRSIPARSHRRCARIRVVSTSATNLRGSCTFRSPPAGRAASRPVT